MNLSSADNLFDTYDADLAQNFQSIEENLAGDAASTRGEARRAVLRRIDMEIDEGDEIVRIAQQEVELQGIPQSIRPKFSARLAARKQQLDSFKKSVKSFSATVDREALLGSSAAQAYGLPSASDDFSVDESQRQRLLDGNARLAQGVNSLQSSHRIALETEDVGAEILRNLRGQREQIESSRSALGEADTGIDRATGTIKRMVRRMYRQRITIYGIIAVLVLLIIIVLYEKILG